MASTDQVWNQADEDRQDLDLESQPTEPPPLGARAGLMATLRWSWRQLTSMRTALVLLFLLALAAIPGSLLPQRATDPSRVQQYYAQHPTLAPILDHVSGFAVFSSPWFAAIYLLLFLSLVGCVVPRSRTYLGVLRSRPPAAPRNLSRLPESDRFEVDASVGDVTAATADLLRAKRFRVDRIDGASPSVAAEKGYLRETGNLLFHIALLVLLVAVAIGSLFGYKANVIVTEGDGFANSVIAYDSFSKGRFFSENRMPPFTVSLHRFAASYVTSGADRGQPESFDAYLSYTSHPGGAKRSYDLRVNSPLNIDGSKIYLLGHGYAPKFTVRNTKGKVVSSGAVPFVAQNKGTQLSRGVLKVYPTKPQLGFQMFFLPTFALTRQGPTSVYPAPLNPVVLLIAYEGDLGAKAGQSQSVFALDTSRMKQLKLPQKSQLLKPGQKVTLPHHRGSIEFTGVKQYAALQVRHDPGKGLALASVIVAIVALLLSLFVRRRRLWVRASAADGGRTVVEVGGLSRSDAGSGFAAEFDGLVEALRTELSESAADPQDRDDDTTERVDVSEE